MPRTPTPWSSRRFRVKLAVLVAIAAIGAASTLYETAAAGSGRGAADPVEHLSDR